MNDLTRDKRLLQHLAFWGIGYYTPITDELLKLFGALEDYRDFKRSDEGVIWQFLKDLKDNQFIKYKVTRYTAHGTPMIDAAIQPKGIEYLNEKPITNTPSNVYNFGDHAQVGQLSSSSLTADIKFETPQTNKPPEKRINKTLKIISAIVAILVAVFGIVKGTIELTRNRKEDKKEASPNKNNEKVSPDSTGTISN